MEKGISVEMVILFNAFSDFRLESLESLSVSGLYKPDPRLVRSLCQFLGHQQEVKTLRLTWCHFTFKGGINVLKALSNSQWLTGDGKGLDVRRFFDLDEKARTFAAHPIFIQEVGKFRAVKDLHLSYNNLSVELLDLLTTDAGDRFQCRLEVLYLYYECEADLSRWAPSNEAWAAAVRRRPTLRLQIYFDDFIEEDIDKLHTAMPLSGVTIDVTKSDAYEESNHAFDATLSELAARWLVFLGRHFSWTLTSFYLDFDEPRFTLQDGEALVEMIGRCPLLRSLDLNMEVPQETALRALDAAAQHNLNGPKWHMTMNVVKEKRSKVVQRYGPVTLSKPFQRLSS